MNWWVAFRRDVGKYQIRNGGSALKQVLTEQGLWALLEYRIASACFRSSFPRPFRAPLKIGFVLWHKLVEVATGISLPSSATIGPGLLIPHTGMRVLHGASVVGSDCCITQGVTIGVSGRGDRRGVPTIGDRVYIGPNAVVVGKIAVGDDAVIGANSLVNRDVPAHCTVLGVPAIVVSESGSEDYLA